MARKLIVLALVFVAIVAGVSAQTPSSAPIASPSPKSAPAPEISSPAPTSEAPVAESPDYNIATPPALESGAAPGSEAVEGPAPGSDGAPAYGPSADDFLAPPPSAASGLEISVIAGVAAVVAGFKLML